jgi:hypothetical protein
MSRTSLAAAEADQGAGDDAVAIKSTSASDGRFM